MEIFEMGGMFMKQISTGDIEVYDLIKRWIVDLYGEYRKMKYVYETKYDSGYLILNGLTQVLVWISEEEYSSFWESDFAMSQFFIVPNDFDDYDTVKRLRKEINDQIYTSDSHPSKYTIFTTTACNARCDYCFEKGVDIQTLSLENSKKIVDYISQKNQGVEQEINLHWFGGEPLLNYKAIDVICSGLESLNCHYFSTITTNGILLNDEMIDRVKENWKTRIIKITLDGTEEIYNKVKSYVIPTDNAFKQIINNIDKCLDKGLEVEVRLNVSRENWTDLISLVDYLCGVIGCRDKFNIYCCPLMGRTGDGECRREGTIDEKLEEGYLEIQKKIFEAGFYKDRIKPTLWTRKCSAERESEYTIMPDGRIGICLLYMDDYAIGHVDEYIENKDIINLFKTHYDDMEKCKNCILYPQCFRSPMCKFDTDDCPIGSKGALLEMIYEQMINEYKHR